MRARDDGNDSVIDSAAYGGNLWIVDQCLAAGEDVNTQDDWGYTPLMNAARAGHIEAMEMLVARGANIRHVAHYQWETALYYAITAEQVEAARWLLERGADPEALIADPEERTTLLGVAASRNYVHLARLLVRFGARPNPENVDELGISPPIHCAAWMGAVEMLSYLLSLGVPVDSRDEENNTPLLCAPSVEAVRVLLEAGANPNVQGLGCSYTKLWIAANYGLFEMGEVLIEYGADPHLRDSATNRSPYEVARDNDEIDFMQMLEERFPNSF